MPPPGWYADPEEAWTWRWWDGVRWSDHRAPMAAPPARDPFSFSTWFEESTAAVKTVVRRAGIAIVAAFAVCSVVLGVVARHAFTSAAGRELRQLLELDDTFGSGSSDLSLSDAEVDRVVELLRELARSWLPWLGLVTLVFAIVSIWATVYAARLADGHMVESGDPPASQRGELIVRGDPASAGAALRRVPAVFGAYIVTGLLLLAVVLAPLVPLIVALAAGADAAILALTGVFGVVAAIVVVFWVSVRLSLVAPVAAIGGHGLGIRRSWDLTGGQFWGTFARLFVAGLIASIATAPLNLFGSFGFTLGATAMLILAVVLQTLSVAASTLVTIPASVVLVHHLDEQHEIAQREQVEPARGW